MWAKGCFYNLGKYRIIPINVMEPHLDAVAPHLRNWQGMCQGYCSPTEIHKYKEKDLHLHDINK